MFLKCSCCSSGEYYPSGEDFLLNHHCSNSKEYMAYFLDTYSKWVESVSLCNDSVEFCSLLTTPTSDPLVVQVYQDVVFLRKHAPALYDAYHDSSLMCTCGDWAAIILGVKLWKNDPRGWKTNNILKVYITAKPSEFLKGDWKRIEEIMQEWDWNEDDSSEFSYYDSSVSDGVFGGVSGVSGSEYSGVETGYSEDEIY